MIRFFQKEQFVIPSSKSLTQLYQISIGTHINETTYFICLIYVDENIACRAAIEQSRNTGNGLITDDLDRHHWLHQWSYLTCKRRSNLCILVLFLFFQFHLIPINS